jgi:hypothetical protein
MDPVASDREKLSYPFNKLEIFIFKDGIKPTVGK